MVWLVYLEHRRPEGLSADMAAEGLHRYAACNHLTSILPSFSHCLAGGVAAAAFSLHGHRMQNPHKATATNSIV
jgi:hypothetical protein